MVSDCHVKRAEWEVMSVVDNCPGIVWLMPFMEMLSIAPAGFKEV